MSQCALGPKLSGRARSNGSLRRSARINGFFFTLPVILMTALVVIFPLLQAFYYSFTRWSGAQANWIGLSNYVTIFSDPDLKQSLTNSFIIFLSIPAGMVIPFMTAYFMSQGMIFGRLFRTLIFAPTALSWVVIGVVARVFFASQGPINGVLKAVGLDALAVNWLADPQVALLAVILTFNAALFGINTIIFLTAMSTVDRSTIEAARLDGASNTRILISIIFPAVRRFIEFVFIITVVTSFTGLFGLIYVMTAGGPGSATTTLEYSVWTRAFASGQFGAGAAIGITLMVLTLGAIALVRLVGKRKEQD